MLSSRPAMRVPAVCLCFFLWAFSSLALADSSGPAPGSREAVAQAKRHFERALDAYRDGAYRNAIGELERALELDPGGKDLVYNLGLVYEKLGEADNAIAQFERYIAMETDAGEAERARTIIRRLEGARAEMAQKRAAEAEQSRASTATEPAPPPPAKPERERGRMDGWVIAAGGLAAAAAVVGVVFGIRALSEQPASDETTGADGSAADMEQRASDAHDLAILADVAFGIALGSAGAGMALYFLRDAEPVTTSRAPPPGVRFQVRF